MEYWELNKVNISEVGLFKPMLPLVWELHVKTCLQWVFPIMQPVGRLHLSYLRATVSL